MTSILLARETSGQVQGIWRWQQGAVHGHPPAVSVLFYSLSKEGWGGRGGEVFFPPVVHGMQRLNPSRSRNPPCRRVLYPCQETGMMHPACCSGVKSHPPSHPRGKAVPDEWYL